MSKREPSPYFEVAGRHASRILDRWNMPAQDRASMHGLIVAALLDAYATGFQNGVDAEPAEQDVPELSPEDVAAVARRVADRGSQLAFVPAVVRPLLDAGHDLGAITEALLAADHARLLELRPESGVGLLKPDDAKLCPRGMRGVVLSWLRVIR